MTTVVVLYLTLLWKKDIKTKKSISKIFGHHFRYDYAAVQLLYIDDRIQAPRAFIRV